MVDYHGYPPELVEQQKSFLTEVYTAGIQSIYISAIKNYKDRAKQYAEEVKKKIDSDRDAMDSAIQGESSQAIRECINTYAQKYDSIGK
ncbi:hypothetical protein EJ419_06080 [Alloscardovia theropitheci]|uniref:Uncharacterized protein n=1 Tax=Alloscardovia theropitheci TaxID=2496842 RepID=A0A4R0QP58_9BIFI|nr:hypothetical protein [Alloscardovia theropitheci]TCD53993.1 hypothetical protein EJ419_06080 [Alloscardovia theropitheci]